MVYNILFKSFLFRFIEIVSRQDLYLARHVYNEPTVNSILKNHLDIQYTYSSEFSISQSSFETSNLIGYKAAPSYF